jgi:hypothetical protein
MNKFIAPVINGGQKGNLLIQNEVMPSFVFRVSASYVGHTATATMPAGSPVTLGSQTAQHVG